MPAFSAALAMLVIAIAANAAGAINVAVASSRAGKRIRSLPIMLSRRR
jgi:hypothetical protein